MLSRPDPALITPHRATAVLRRLGVEWADGDCLIRPTPPVVPLSQRDPSDWWVGDDAVVTWRGDEGFPAEGPWACDCTPEVPAHCAHVATAILAHAWNLPETRGLFDQPAWALQLEGLLRPKDEEGDAAQPGYIRYLLVPAADSNGLPIRRNWVRLSRRDGRQLRPQPVPQSFAVLSTTVAGLTEGDLAFHRAAEARELLGTLAPGRHEGERVRTMRLALAAEAMHALMQLDTVWYADRPVRVDPRPFHPELIVRDADEADEADDDDDDDDAEASHILLNWAVPLLEAYPVGPGYVLTGRDALRPLAENLHPEICDALMAPLPKVPVADAPRFLENFVHPSGVRLQLQSAHLPPTLAADDIHGRVILTEDDDALHVELRFAYQLGADVVELGPKTPGSLLAIGEVLADRDPDREAELRARLCAILGRSVPAVLRKEAALDFLLDGRQRLGSTWRFFGAAELTHHRLAGDLKAQVRVPSGIDWFDMRVEFQVGDRTVAAKEVLTSWLEGQRYVRLDDGALARLPEEWLAKFGRASQELQDLRAAGDGHLPTYAAPIVAELLEEAEGDLTPWRNLLASLEDFTGIPDYPLPEGLDAELRHYQEDGFRWLRFLQERKLGGCLADDMGLGKTIQAITALLDVHQRMPNGPPSLVVSPTSVVHNWEIECGRFAPALRVWVHHGPLRNQRPNFDDIDVVVTSYALLRLDRARFGTQPWQYVILDEAQQIKNPQSKVARVARSLDAQHRLALTGTPLENHLLELWSIFEFLMPGFFGTRATFQRRYAQPIQRDLDAAAMSSLRRRLRPFILRRIKGEVASELPPRQEQILYCELGEAQRALYERVKSTYRDAVLGRVAEVGMGAATLSVLEALMRLRQACCDPALLPFTEADSVPGSAKLDLLEETLIDIISAGHRTLVFSQWPSLLRRVVSRIERRGWTYLYLDGRTQQRGNLVVKWNDPAGPPIFLISLKAGGAGLNLTGADHVIHLDPWWNPAAEDQATSRAHRIGQTKPVIAYKLVARDTVEEKILELQARKRALFEAAVEQDRLVVEQLTQADLEAVFAPEGMEVEPLERRQEGPAVAEAPAPPAVPGPLKRMLRPGVHLTNARVRELTGWGAARARRWLREQVETGALEQRGRKRGTHYIVPG